VPQDGASKMCVKLIERHSVIYEPAPKCHKLMHKHKTSLLKIAFRIIFTKNSNKTIPQRGCWEVGRQGGQGEGSWELGNADRVAGCLWKAKTGSTWCSCLRSERTSRASSLSIHPAADATYM